VLDEELREAKMPMERRTMHVCPELECRHHA